MMACEDNGCAVRRLFERASPGSSRGGQHTFIAKYAPIACAVPFCRGDRSPDQGATPRAALLAIVGGSKVSTKITILAQLAQKVDQLIVGGGIANTFMLAAGLKIGKSLCEPELVGEAQTVMSQLKAKGGEVPLPIDVVCAKELSQLRPPRQRTWRDREVIIGYGPRLRAA